MDSVNPIFFIIREFIWPFIVGTAVIWVPLVLLWISFSWWLEYVRKLKVLEAKWTLIEIKIPKEITKSPAAMEVILTSLYADTRPPLFMPKGPKTNIFSFITDFEKWYNTLWNGSWPLWRSLEIVSIEGTIYFFIRCESKHREMIENLIYSQFPQAEVTETDDYTKYVPPFQQGNGWELRGLEYKLKYDSYLPLKTYVDYGLHEAFQLEENQKIDPIVPLLQAMGSLGQGEQAWLQIVIQGSWAHFENPNEKKRAEKPFLTWQEWGRAYIDGVVEKYSTQQIKKKGKTPEQDEYMLTGGYRNLPQYEKDRLEAIERAIIKPGYDAGMRLIYLAHTEKFKKDKLGEIQNALKQFNAPNLNVLEGVNATDDGFDYPWRDYKDMRKIYNREKLFKRYVMRDFFYPPQMGATVAIKKVLDRKLTSGTIGSVRHMVLNTEELATLFHFPGSVATTSALGRIEAQKAEPPSNLPI